LTPNQALRIGLQNHIIFIGLKRSVLDNIAPLRYKGEESNPAVVIIMKEEDINKTILKLISPFRDVYIVKGDGHDLNVLDKVGLADCRYISVVPGDNSQIEEEGGDPYLVDSDAIFTIRHVLKTFSGEKERKSPPQFLVELMFASNLKFIQPSLIFPNKLTCKDILMCRPFFDFLKTYTPDFREPTPLHPLVGSGSAWFSESLLKILPNIWKTGGRVLQFVRLLLRLSEKPLQLQCSSGLHCIDLPEEMAGSTFGEMFQAFCQQENHSIPIGLYRTAEGPFGPFRYVFTNPEVDCLLRADDKVYVLITPAHDFLEQSLYEAHAE
jgi:hypothetical protein